MTLVVLIKSNNKILLQRISLSYKKTIYLTLFILVRHTSKLNYRIIIVNTVQCDSVRIYFTAFTCFDQLTIFRRLVINMFSNYYYMVCNTYLELLHNNYLQLFGLKIY
jgi:hypothetical protein